MKIKICVAITAKTMQELEAMVEKAEKEGASLIEIRLDHLDVDYTSRDIRRLTRIPLIATNRLPREGGLFKGKEDRRISSLINAASNGFDFIDVELVTKDIRQIIKKIRETDVKIIISKHNFFSTPSIKALNAIFKEEMSLGADVCKIVTTAKKADDNLTCLQFVAEASKLKEVICFSMGQLGLLSRLLSPTLGGFLTYAAIEEGKESAPGQITIIKARSFYELMKYDYENNQFN